MLYCELRHNPMMVHIHCLYAKMTHGAWLLASGGSFSHGNAKASRQNKLSVYLLG